MQLIKYSVFFAFWMAAFSCAPLSLPFQTDGTLLFQPAPSFAFAFLSSFHPLFTPRLIQLSDVEPPYWTTELNKHLLRIRGVNFFDITSEVDHGPLCPAKISMEEEFPKKPSYRAQLDEVFGEISEKGPREDIAKFTSFRNRYYKSETGRTSQLWLLEKVKEVASASKDVKVREFPHSWGQSSIILHVPGQHNTSKSSPVTILGAHLDSTHLLPILPAPGADDDGSGTVTILEALRALLAKGWKPLTDVEWHWYSAEEGGLLGSQEVVRDYVERNVVVKAMLQQDMTAFVKQGTEERVGLVSDFVSSQLHDFLKVLVRSYLSIPSVDTKLGYAGSDHASWNKAGFPSAFAIEATFEDSNLQRIHTGNDVFDIPEYSFSHLMQFVKLSAAFAVELGGWS